MINEESITKRCDELKALLISKNADYGSSMEREPIFAKELGPLEASKVRMSDKVHRLETLFGKYRNGTCESIEDTLYDLAGYALNMITMIKDTNNA